MNDDISELVDGMMEKSDIGFLKSQRAHKMQIS